MGTGDSLSPWAFTMPAVYRFPPVERFFTDNYDHPIIEDGIQLVDMVYLKRERDMA